MRTPSLVPEETTSEEVADDGDGVRDSQSPREIAAPKSAPNGVPAVESARVETQTELRAEPVRGMAAVIEAARLRRKAGLLATGLLLFGFVGGYGVGYGVRKREAKRVEADKPVPSLAIAPIVKAMRMSPDGRLLAFTAVYDQSRKSSRFVLNVTDGSFSASDSPVGWQDFVVGWDRKGSSLLLKRDRIPPPVAEASAGFYRQRLLEGRWPRFEAGEQELETNLPRGEKSLSGFWDEREKLVVKSRREPKSIFLDGKKLDASPDLYLQNRVVRENNRDVLYAVRNSGSDLASAPALVRVENGKSRRLSEDLEEMEWAYIAEDASAMIVARLASNEVDWRWSLYKITPQRAVKVQEATVSGDAIGVAWSPDKKKVLGLNGRSLWLIDVPGLKSRAVGGPRVANADDATWSMDSKSVLVAVDGKIFQLNLASNELREVWKFPDAYWS